MPEPKRHPAFCTACGESLEEFCFSAEARDVDALRAHVLRCRIEGRHQGGVCAKLYIASDTYSAHPDATDPVNVQSVSEERLRAAIASRIAQEEERRSGPPSPPAA
jgi:hypothetical protein